MRIVALFAAMALTACSQSPADVSSLPMKFVLKCDAPTGSGIPEGAKEGFDIIVDRTINSSSIPWWNKPQSPIAKVGAKEIVLINDHVDQGMDGNPEDRKLSFDLRKRTLHFLETYAALVPVRNEFSTHCEIKNA
jgi:hypothetical protein